MKKILIDSKFLSKGDSVRGIGVHTSELFKILKKEKEIDFDINAARGKKYDLYHYPKFHPYFFSLPFLKKGRTVLTIHDLIYLIYPDKYPPGTRGSLKFFIQKQLLRRVDLIITISETSKKDICRFLKVRPEKVRVIHLAPKKVFKRVEKKDVLKKVREKYGLPERFVLYVGDVNYNKNLNILAEACKIIKIPLVIVGKHALAEDVNQSHIENRPLVDFLEKYSNDKDILRIGFVADKDLAVVYTLANIYCQPSLYEGFGLPVLEAFACGTPVVASKIQAHSEIAGDGALLFDPKEVKDLAGKLFGVLRDKSFGSDLVKKGLEKVKEYSWEKTAKETLDLYKEILLLK